MFQTFLEIWDERADKDGNNRCYETGALLKREYFRKNSCCYHHVMAKSKYEDLTLHKDFILILHPDIHSQVEVNIDKTPRVKEFTEKTIQYLEKTGYFYLKNNA